VAQKEVRRLLRPHPRKFRALVLKRISTNERLLPNKLLEGDAPKSARASAVSLERMKICVFASLVLMLSAAGCSMVGYSKREPLGKVELYPVGPNSYQVRLPYRSYGRGNVHDPFDYDKREYVWADWIVVTGGGDISPVDASIHACPHGHEKPALYGTRSVRGTVRLSQDIAHVALQVHGGRSQDGIPVWVAYEHNGIYALVRPQHRPIEATPVSAAECLP
jgi:hypothetical protein